MEDKNTQLLFNSIFLIQEPPGSAILNFAFYCTIIKIAGHGGKQFIIGRIKIVQNCFRQLTAFIKMIE